MGETPFKLAYGSEVVIPVEVHMENHISRSENSISGQIQNIVESSKTCINTLERLDPQITT